MKIGAAAYGIAIPLAIVGSTPACSKTTPRALSQVGVQTVETAGQEPDGWSSLVRMIGTSCRSIETACPDIALSYDADEPLERVSGRIALSRDFFDRAQSDVDRAALAAIVVAFADHAEDHPQASGNDLGRQLLAIGVLAGGEAIDPIRNPADSARRSNNFRYRGEAPLAAPSPLGAEALAISNKTIGCSGPFVDFLERTKASSQDPNVERRRTAIFARAILRQLGPEIYPPDYSCVARAPEGSVRPTRQVIAGEHEPQIPSSAA